MNTRSAPRVGGFTLIEVLVVIGIIVILAGLVVSTAGYIQDKQARAKAEGQIAVFEAVLEDYKADNGTYPIAKDPESYSSTVLIEELMPKSTTEKAYFAFPKNMLSSTNNPQSGQVLDPWGNPYYYYYNPGGSGQNPKTRTTNNGPAYYDLWSEGRKSRSGEPRPETWIKNW